MIKGMVISRIITRYSVIMALRAAEQELRDASKAGKIPIIAGLAAGVVAGWFIYGLLGAVIGGAAGAAVIHAYKKK